MSVMEDSAVFSLEEFPVHLGLGAVALREPRFNGLDWYAAYGARRASDGVEGRLVSMYTFHEPWGAWEMHPNGDELVVCMQGRMTLHQSIDGVIKTLTLGPGEATINPPGVWHTADVAGSCTAMFITAGLGTEHRPR
jgi:mannose-6-phosphate isomerase-like protein (cupin superfamily)